MYRRISLLILLLFGFGVGNAQNVQPFPPNTYVKFLGGAGADSILNVPVRDTVDWLGMTGSVTIRPQDGRIYYNNGAKWVPALVSGDTVWLHEAITDHIAADQDLSPDNELQIVTWTDGTRTLAISDGNSVVIPTVDTSSLSDRIDAKPSWSDTVSTLATKDDISGMITMETDPTVAAWVKAITQGDINQWDAAEPNVQSDWNATSGDAFIQNKPSSLPPSGAAGGDLSGTYPNPQVVDNSHNHTIANVTGLQSALNSKPSWSDTVATIATKDDIAGFITTETDPTVPAHVKAITTTNITNWSQAFTWGNHATAGYEIASNKRTSLASPNNTTYPTTQAVQNAINSVPTHDPVTLDGEDYLSISGQVITAEPIDLSGSNTTGSLPAASVSGLADVATSGDYNDLSNTPTIPGTPNLNEVTSVGNNSGQPITITGGPGPTVGPIDTLMLQRYSNQGRISVSTDVAIGMSGSSNFISLESGGTNLSVRGYNNTIVANRPITASAATIPEHLVRLSQLTGAITNMVEWGDTVALIGTKYDIDTLSDRVNAKEDVANKRTSLISPNITTYPSTQAVVDYVTDVANDYIPLSEKGAANGVATLGANGKLPNSQVPAIAITETFVVNSQAAMLALSTAEQGDVAVRTDLSKSMILVQAPPSTLANWQELLTPTGESTNLSLGAATGTSRAINNSNGTGVTLPAATAALAGLMSGADKTKLDGVQAGAEVNVNPDWDATSGDAFIENKPSSMPPSGSAGGDLTGTYPNPSIANGAVTNAKINDVAWSKVTGAPSFLTTETDPTVPAHVKSITTGNISQWNAAEQNVQSDWDAVSGDAFILNKPAIPLQLNPTAGTGMSITGTYPNLTFTNTAPNVPSNLAVGTRTNTTVPITNSNGNGVTIPAATTTLAGVMTGTEKAKLNGIQAGAQVNAPPQDLQGVSVVGNVTDQALRVTGYGGFDPTGSDVDGLTMGFHGAGTITSLGYLWHNGKTILLSMDNFGGSSDGMVMLKNPHHGVTMTLEDDRAEFNTTVSGQPAAAADEFVVRGQIDTIIPDVSGFVPSARTITAGNGLTGGGTLAADRTITLGTPGSITASSTNSVTATSHTHELASNAVTTAKIANGAVTNAKINDVAWSKVTGAPSFLTSESDPTVPSHVKSITTGNIAQWNAAEQNVQSDWNAASGDAAILNKPTIPAAANNGTLTMSTSADLTGSATFGANQATNSSFTVGLAAGTLTKINNGQTAFGWGDHASAGYVPSGRSITAGNGMTGGGTLAANRTITMGTPSSITLSSTNSVTTSSHTHAFTPGGTTGQYIRGDGSLASFPSIPTVGNGTLSLNTSGIASGSGSFTANQSGNSSFTVNVPGTNLGLGTAQGSITSSTGSGTVLRSLGANYSTTIRNTDAGYADYYDGMRLEFKNVSALPGVTGTSYAGLLSLAPYNDATGRYSFGQFSFSTDGLFYRKNTDWTSTGVGNGNFVQIADRDWVNSQGFISSGTNLSTGIPGEIVSSTGTNARLFTLYNPALGSTDGAFDTKDRGLHSFVTSTTNTGFPTSAFGGGLTFVRNPGNNTGRFDLYNFNGSSDLWFSAGASAWDKIAGKDWADGKFQTTIPTSNFTNANTPNGFKLLLGTDGLNTNNSHGLWIPHGGSSTSYGSEIWFRNGAFGYRSLENNVWTPWRVVADRDWVNAQIPSYGASVSIGLTGGNFFRQALTGDVTAPANSNTTTIANNAVTTAKIANNAVTYAKMQDINTQSIIGREAAGSGDPEQIKLGEGLEIVSGELRLTGSGAWTDELGYDYEGNADNAAKGLDTRGGYASRTQTFTTNASVADNVETVVFMGTTIQNLALPDPDDFHDRVIQIVNAGGTDFNLTTFTAYLNGTFANAVNKLYPTHIAGNFSGITIKSVYFPTTGFWEWLIIDFNHT